MNNKMREALLEMYSDLDEAGRRQEERGKHDQGERSKVTSGKHLDSVAAALCDDLVSVGYSPEGVYYENGCLTLPGWFRPTKVWDLAAFDGEDLLAVIELKSINSSFGNNCNNRVEESLGSAVDAALAIEHGLIPYRVLPPIIGYVMVVRLCERSTRYGEKVRNTIFPVDDVFLGASYLDRLTELGRRLIGERLYQAVWIVGVDPSSGRVVEPDQNLSYENFIATLESQLAAHRR